MKRLASLLIICGFSFPAAAYFQMDLLKGKKTNVEAKRWTLSDWLAQKNKQRLADQWLALHSSSNDFELLLSGGYEAYKMKTDLGGGTMASTDEYGQAYNVDLFVAIFDLHGEFEKNSQRREANGGALGVRLLGTSSQSTSLVARYGFRKMQDFAGDIKFESQFAEGLLQLYILDFFALTGGYRQYFKAQSVGYELSGSRTTAGAHLEFSIFRIYGTMFWEPMPVENAAVVYKHERNGYEAGLTLIF